MARPKNEASSILADQLRVEASESKETMSQDERTRIALLNALNELGGLTIGEDDLIFEGTRMILPESYKGNIPGVVKYLRNYQEQQDTGFNFIRTFNYRPMDGAAAFERALKRLFGSTGVGGTIQTFFGPIPPEYRTINIGPDETLQVPWNMINFAPLEASFYLGTTRSREYGTVFQVTVEAPRKNRAAIEAFFRIVEDELRIRSIYRGRAFTGGDEPIFLDTKATDRTRVIYSEDVQTQLDTNMWSLLRYSAQMRKNRIPLKRAVLVEGEYGTGKTLAGQLTAKEAEENGWTFIIARPGQDNLSEVLKTAQLYAPAVVWYEDIDTIAQGQNDLQISKLLDDLDGITNKGVEVLAGFTTNHVKKIQKGVLRPGRLDAVIHIGGLDAAGFEKLIKVVLPEDLQGEIDFAHVANAFGDMVPAFAKEAIDRAMRYSISRNGGVPDKIMTDDLVNAALGLRPQLALMIDAVEGVRTPPLNEAIRAVVEEGVMGIMNRSELVDSDGDEWNYKVRIAAEDGTYQNLD